MTLWVRSQDKKHLMKCEAIMYEKTGAGYGLRVFTKNYDFNIANYETNERALEVLDEIQNILQPVVYTHEPKINYDDLASSITGQFVVQSSQKVEMELKQAGQFVYQMPKE